jgi:hypothetical protein
VTFYGLLEDLARRVGGPCRLADCNGRQGWPDRGVYFFFERGEERSDSGLGARVVRVGTHALSLTSGTTLWNRLSQHRGPGGRLGGNHRGSIFRLLVGAALQQRMPQDDRVPSWGEKNDLAAAARMRGEAVATLRMREDPIEAAVSQYIGQMPFLWIDVPDPSGPENGRAIIERESIALLSSRQREALDPPSADWLGRSSDRLSVRESGLWNNQLVDRTHDPAFLDVMAAAVARTGPLRR